MLDKHVIWIARELFACVMILVVFGAFFGSADRQRQARVLRDGSLEFGPNRRSFVAWPIVMTYLIYATINRAMHIHASALNLIVAAFMGLVTISVAVTFPAKIIVADNGLEQVSWLWKNKLVRWEDIVEVNSGEKSRTVTITGVDRTRIVHSRQLPDRPRLLAELDLHCGHNLLSDFPQSPILR